MRNFQKDSLYKIYQVLKDKNINLVSRGIPKIKSNAIEHPFYLSYENTFKLFKLGIVPVNVDAYWFWNNYPSPSTIPTIRVDRKPQSICPIFRKEEFENYIKDMSVYKIEGTYIGDVVEHFKGEYVVYKISDGQIFLAVSDDLEDAQVRVLEQMFDYNNDVEYWVDEWFDAPESM